jgi:uncharacterized membrane protein YhhN
MTVTFLVLAGLAAVVDWAAVARGRHAVELAAKPITLALLVVAAGFADVGAAKPWVVAALALGLLGDIALLFSHAENGADGDEPSAAFFVGLGAFLLGHLAWIVAFARHGVHSWQLLAGALVVAGGLGLVAPRVLRGASAAGGQVLAGAVAGYSATLAAMVVFAFGTTAVATAAGGALFLVSDSTLAWDRFVRRLVRGPVIVMVTYHLAQGLLLIGLIRHF